MSVGSARIMEIDEEVPGGDSRNRFTELEEEFDDDMDFDLPELPTPAAILGHGPEDPINPSGIKYVEDTAQFKSWSCLYPVYFDVAKSTKQGRRVSTKEAVKNPLAKTIADACKVIGFSVVFEPQKCHPSDWSNPGRVRVEIKDASGNSTHRSIKTKTQLYSVVSSYLIDHPTLESDPSKVPVPGIDGSKSKRAVVPKGMKINDIIPLHSPAMAGQGMDSNGLASMMGSMFPGMSSMLSSDEPETGPSQAPPQVTAEPKKPKMKRQFIR